MNQVTNLNQFKTFLSQNVGKDTSLENHILPERSRQTKILHVQSNSFVIKSANPNHPENDINKHSWENFDTAKTWEFTATKTGFAATKKSKLGNPIITLTFEY